MTEREGGESKKANEASSEIPGWVELENEATPHGSQTMTGEGRMVMKLMQGLRKWLGVLTAVGLLAGGFDVAEHLWLWQWAISLPRWWRGSS